MSQLSFIERCTGIYYRKIFSPLMAMLLKSRGIQIGRGVIFYGCPIIQLAPSSSMIIEDGCVLCSHSSFTAMGVSRPVTLKTLLPSAKLFIGRNVGVSGVVLCAAQSLEIGADTMLGSGCIIVDTDFHPSEAQGRRDAPLSQANHRPVRICENAFIGAGAFIGKGVTIGRDSVIGAMSVVTRDVPEGTVAAGNPAKIIRRAVMPQ